MAVLQIIKSANNIQRGHSLSLAQTKSDGGIRKAQVRGPLLYNVSITVNQMYDNSEDYYEIENEIINKFKYGRDTVSTQMPAVEVKNRGTWAGLIKVKGASQSGITINLKGFTSDITNIVMANDWVQFVGSTKVYQITSNASSDSSGNVTIILNTPLIGSIVDNAAVVHGNAVAFNFALVNPGSIDPTKTPAGANHNLAEWGTFEFEEVLL